jgi:hypothetical protein
VKGAASGRRFDGTPTRAAQARRGSSQLRVYSCAFVVSLFSRVHSLTFVATVRFGTVFPGAARPSRAFASIRGFPLSGSPLSHVRGYRRNRKRILQEATEVTEDRTSYSVLSAPSRKMIRLSGDSTGKLLFEFARFAARAPSLLLCGLHSGLCALCVKNDLRELCRPYKTVILAKGAGEVEVPSYRRYE